MAYTKVSLDRQEKTGLAIAFTVMLISLLNRAIPPLKDFWDGLDERIDEAVQDSFIIASGYALLLGSRALTKAKGFQMFGVFGQIVGFSLIFAGFLSFFGYDLFEEIRKRFS